MPIGSIWLITTQKVPKTRSVKSMEQHYIGSNHGLTESDSPITCPKISEDAK